MASNRKRVAEKAFFNLKMVLPIVWNIIPKTIAISSGNSFPDDSPLLNITCSNGGTVEIKKITSGYKLIELPEDFEKLKSSMIQEKVALHKPPSTKGGVLNVKLTVELYEKKGKLLASGFVDLELGCRRKSKNITTEEVGVTLSRIYEMTVQPSERDQQLQQDQPSERDPLQKKIHETKTFGQ